MATDIKFFKIPNEQQTVVQIRSKIARIDAIIDSLYNTALISVGNGDKIQYEIDTGQTKQKVEYTDPKQVTDAIESYERIRQLLVNKTQPRCIRLVDSKNFR